MKNKKKLSGLKVRQQALYILIFSFVTVVVWIGGSLFRSQKRTGIAPALLELAKPLSPTVNEEVIGLMEESTYYSPEELLQFQIYKLIKSKDGRVQQVVPIDSGIDEIPEDQINVFVSEEPTTQENLSNQEAVENDIGTGAGTFDTQTQSVSSPTPSPSPESRSPAATPFFGEDGRYYLD
jgi:hypothetical protein